MKICQQRVPQSRHQDRHAEARPRDAMVKPSNLQNTKEQEKREQPGEIRLLDTDSHTKNKINVPLNRKVQKASHTATIVIVKGKMSVFMFFVCL